MKIGILGGTFDPVHRGHLLLARAAKDQAGLDLVLFIPAFIPPHKAERRDLTPAPYRYQMVELAIRNEPQFEISDLEFSRPELSYTVDTLRELKKLRPADEFYLILGADAASQISSWHEPDEIRRLAGILAVKRPDTAPFHDNGIRWLEMASCPVSSSGLRKQIEQGRLDNPSDLPNGVEDFIRSKKLYGGRLCPSS